MIRKAVLFIKNRVRALINKVIERVNSVEWKNIRIQKEDVKIGCGFSLIVIIGVLIKKFIKAVRRK